MTKIQPKLDVILQELTDVLRKRYADRYVRPVAHGGVVGPGDDNDFIEFQAWPRVDYAARG